MWEFFYALIFRNILISMKVVKACLSCGCDFESYKSQNKKFCSRNCMLSFNKTEAGRLLRSQKINKTKAAKGTRGYENRKCKQCGSVFETQKSEKKSFCTKQCRYEHLSVNKDLMLEKQHKTNTEKYGYKYATKNKQIIESIRRTAAERYGNEHPRFSDESMKKRIETCINKYGKPYAPSFSKQSKDEKEIVDYIKTISPKIHIQQNNRSILNGKELDIYIPSLNLAIEYNGLYYHSELRKPERKYHLNKTKQAEKEGVRLIHLFSDEWHNRKDIVKVKIQNLILSQSKSVYARKCEIKEIKAKEANTFLNETHIQGEDKSRHKIGLYYRGELVALMTFSVGRASMGSLREEGKWELSRFSTKGRVVGGASKLLKYFVRNYKPNKIISYADRRWSMGNLYEKLGFENTGNSAPSYWYTKDYRERLYRYNFRKSVLVNLGADPSKTEWEIMQELGYDRIWDCGTIRYEMTF